MKSVCLGSRNEIQFICGFAVIVIVITFLYSIRVAFLFLVLKAHCVISQVALNIALMALLGILNKDPL